MSQWVKIYHCDPTIYLRWAFCPKWWPLSLHMGQAAIAVYQELQFQRVSPKWSLRYEPGVLGWASCPVLPYHWLVPHWFDRFIINHRNKLGWWVCVTTVANILNYIFKTSTNCKIWREPICRVTLLWLFVNVWSVVYRKISHTFVFLIDIMDIIYMKSCLVLLAGTLLRHE